MNINEFLPILIPLIILQFGLGIYAVIDILRQKSYKIGNRVIWIPVVLLLSIIGPVLYFVFGKEKD
ncbi:MULTISPECIES: PLD nuclease N-terminal domain-containing protein [unclassified Enterococcus]|uniref:PLD nuclease N-terminal domain-containing protein n=1 Tax=unclassified Enterococcus TaxID=2608891 RepID=UPI002476FCB3|nr:MULTISPECIES: PLD nuclease N-terminal domain-containing protein [unclassified Enterococcus]